VLDALFDVGLGGGEGDHPPAEDVVQVLEALVVHVQDGHLGPHPQGDLGGVGAHGPAPKDHHAGRGHPRHPPEEDPPAPLGLLQELGPHLGGHPPRHLAHGDEEGEGAVGKLNGLISDARDPATEHGLGEAAVCGKVQVGEEDEPFPQEAVLLG